MKQFASVLSLYALCLLLVVCSRINLFYFLKRTWVFIPLFSIFIAFPAIFEAFTPGSSLYSFSISGFRLTVTNEGLSGAVLFVSRVITSVSLVITLALTTRHTDLLKVLRVMGIPQVFVMTIGMCYRYIYLFVEIVERNYLAIKSRVGGSVHHQKGRHIVAWNMATLWTRSYHLNNQVYDAMLSRGYRGEPMATHAFTVRLIDWIWLSLIVSLASIILIM
jgi:cobalt/nickel transport system permease protein